MATDRLSENTLYNYLYWASSARAKRPLLGSMTSLQKQAKNSLLGPVQIPAQTKEPQVTNYNGFKGFTWGNYTPCRKEFVHVSLCPMFCINLLLNDTTCSFMIVEFYVVIITKCYSILPKELFCVYVFTCNYSLIKKRNTDRNTKHKNQIT